MTASDGDAQPLLRKLRRDEAAAPIAGEESTVGEEAPFPLSCVRRQRHINEPSMS